MWQSVFFGSANALCVKLVGATSIYGNLSKMAWISLPSMVSHVSQVREPACLYAITMQDRKDMREKNIQPKIYWDAKIDAK